MPNNGISIIDFVGKFEDGIAVNLSMVYENKAYFLMYWFNKEGKRRIVAEDEFYKDFNFKSIYELPHIKELFIYIDNEVLPKREDIWKEFGI